MRTLLKNDKKGQLGTLQAVVMSLVVIGIVLGIGFLVLEEFYDQLTAGDQSALAVNETIVAMAEIPEWLSIVIILVIVGVLLAIVFSVMPRGQTTAI